MDNFLFFSIPFPWSTYRRIYDSRTLIYVKGSPIPHHMTQASPPPKECQYNQNPTCPNSRMGTSNSERNPKKRDRLGDKTILGTGNPPHFAFRFVLSLVLLACLLWAVRTGECLLYVHGLATVVGAPWKWEIMTPLRADPGHRPLSTVVEMVMIDWSIDWIAKFTQKPISEVQQGKIDLGKKAV